MSYAVHWYNRNDITDKGSQSGLDESEAIWLLSHGTFQRQLADYYYWSVPTLHAESTRVFNIRLKDEMAQRRVDVLEDENRRYKAALGTIAGFWGSNLSTDISGSEAIEYLVKIAESILAESEA